jgi:hypothetical protein
MSGNTTSSAQGASAPPPTDPNALRVIAACEKNWDAHKGDCSGFVRAVAHDLDITLTGLADAIVGEIEAAPWTTLGAGAAQAGHDAAEAGKLVIAGLRGADQANPDPHGHVVVVVKGAMVASSDGHSYPLGYWGRLGSVGAKDKGLNFAWSAADRPHVFYASIAIAP